jgi:hypothetical protein
MMFLLSLCPTLGIVEIFNGEISTAAPIALKF